MVWLALVGVGWRWVHVGQLGQLAQTFYLDMGIIMDGVVAQH